MRKKLSLKFALVMCLSVIWLIFGVSFAYAAGVVKFDTQVSGVEFQVYKIGIEDENGKVVLTGDFSAYRVSPDATSAAAVLSAYAKRDGIKPLGVGVTDANGIGVYGDLEDGAYLIAADRFYYSSNLYEVLPAIVIVRGEEVDITGKLEMTHSSKLDQAISYSVMKVWDGAVGGEITAQLLRDGAVYDEVVLNESNNWRYTWEGLSYDYQWYIVEKDVPEGYNVSVDRDGLVFVIVNTKDETPEGPKEPTTEATTEAPDEPTTSGSSGRDEPTTREPEPEATTKSPKKGGGGGGGDSYILNPDEPKEKPDAPSHKDYPTTPDEPQTSIDTPEQPTETPETVTETAIETTTAVTEGEKLPQTGQLWTPVPALAFAGMLCIIIGIGKKRLGD